MMDEEDENKNMIAFNGIRINWGEYMRLTIQALHSLGYGDTAKLLEIETDSSYIHEPEKFEDIRAQFNIEFWDKCAETLTTVEGFDEETVSDVMFLIIRIWLLECMDLNRSFPAVKVLLHKYLHYFTRDNGDKMTNIMVDFLLRKDDGYIDGLTELRRLVELRKLIWKRFEDRLPPTTAMPDKTLLAPDESGLSAQMDSLYQDHSWWNEQLPRMTLQILNDHLNAVLHVKFSHNGDYLASSSADFFVIIWEVSADRLLKKWEYKHNKPIIGVVWGPNNDLLLTTEHGEKLRIWDLQKGGCIFESIEGITVHRSSAFLMTNRIDVAFASYKPPRYVQLLKNLGEAGIVTFFRTEGRVIEDFALTPNGRKLAIFCPDSEEKVLVKDLHTGVCETISLQEKTLVCGFSFSDDSESLMLNLSNNEIQVWDLNRLKDLPGTYSGLKKPVNSRSRFQEACFGGVKSAFLASGSTDSNVYIWSRGKREPILVLKGHESQVRCVSWNPKRPQMLASASDDRTIRIWGWTPPPPYPLKP